MTPMLEARALSLHRRLAPTDLSIDSAELVAIIGPNGSGKTSLLRALCGIERSSGRTWIAGEELVRASPERRAGLASFLPASREVVWPISAREVIALGLPSPSPSRVNELVAMLELSHLANRPIDQLSTGERARVLLARAMAPRPKVLLLDEPLSNLDPYWVLRILEILRRAVTDGCCALISLHDIDKMASFDRVLLMEEGKLSADLVPGEMIGSRALSTAFRILKTGDAWQISQPPEDRQSSP